MTPGQMFDWTYLNYEGYPCNRRTVQRGRKAVNRKTFKKAA
jgi:hypothetical protein